MKYFLAPPSNAPRGISSDNIFAFWMGRLCENTQINVLITNCINYIPLKLSVREKTFTKLYFRHYLEITFSMAIYWTHTGSQYHARNL